MKPQEIWKYNIKEKMGNLCSSIKWTSDRLLIPQEMGITRALITDSSWEKWWVLSFSFFLECFEGVVFVKSSTCDFCLEGNSQINQWSQKQSCKTILNFFYMDSSLIVALNIASSTRFVLQFTLLLRSMIVF